MAKTGTVLGSVNMLYAKRKNVTLHMLFGVPKPDASTRLIFNLSDEIKLDYSLSNLIDLELCTIE